VIFLEIHVFFTIIRRDEVKTMEFHERLKHERKKLKLTQEEFGKNFNLSKQAISSYEKGLRQPNPDLLKAFAKFLDVSVDFLLCETNVRHQHDVLAFHTTEALTEEEIEEVRKYIEFLKTKRDD
jgi:transcriptional regulator with XRE-family HTH domain